MVFARKFLDFQPQSSASSSRSEDVSQGRLDLRQASCDLTPEPWFVLGNSQISSLRARPGGPGRSQVTKAPTDFCIYVDIIWTLRSQISARAVQILRFPASELGPGDPGIPTHAAKAQTDPGIPTYKSTNRHLHICRYVGGAGVDLKPHPRTGEVQVFGTWVMCGPETPPRGGFRSSAPR